MDIEQTLKKVAERLRSGLLDNEEQVKTSSVLPILRALGWDPHDPEDVRAEYRAGGGRVDYALMGRDDDSPLVFVEAKPKGGVDAGAEGQLFEYGADRGVTFLVLTDGDQWDLHLNTAEGRPQDRRFYRLELDLFDKLPEYAESLKHYLEKDRVRWGKARLAAEEMHTARRTIPAAFRGLLERSNDGLRDLLTEQVAGACGIRPESRDVEEYLDYLKEATGPDAPAASERRRADPPPAPPPAGAPLTAGSRLVGFVLDGESVRTRSAVETLAELLKKFDETAPDFMDRFASRTAGRTRALVARNRDDLFPGQPDFAEKNSLDLGNGWWLGANLGVEAVKRRIEIACDVSGVQSGARLRLTEE